MSCDVCTGVLKEYNNCVGMENIQSIVGSALIFNIEFFLGKGGGIGGYNKGTIILAMMHIPSAGVFKTSLRLMVSMATKLQMQLRLELGVQFSEHNVCSRSSSDCFY